MDALKKGTENAEAKIVADLALSKSIEDLRVADAAFEVARQREEVEKNAVKCAEVRLKEATTAQMEAKKIEATAKTALTKASADLKKAKGEAIDAATVAESEATVVLAQASEALVNADIALAQAKQAVNDTKAADKETDKDFQNVTKLQGDFKRAEAKAADTATKAAAKIAQQTASLETLTSDFAALEEQMKKATDEAAAAELSDNEAKLALANAKQAEKDADNAFKTATKACVDAKSNESKGVDLIKKSQANVDFLQSKLSALSTSMTLGISTKKINDLDSRNAARKVKFDEASQDLAAAQAKLTDFKLQIENSKADKLRVCKEARDPETQEIIQNLCKARDQLLFELNDAEAQYAVIAKLRNDRVTLFGQAEIDRRIAVQTRIMTLKSNENDRSNSLPRICNVCNTNVGNVHQKIHHRCISSNGALVLNPTFTCTGTNYNEVTAPHLDGRGFWGTEWETKPDTELIKYPFQEDIAMCPYSSWWHDYIGGYRVAGTCVPRAMDHGENGTPTADAAYAALPENLKPLPPLVPIASSYKNIFEDRDLKMFLRYKLQVGAISERGDRFEFLSNFHSWYRDVARNALCKDCGLDPDTLKKA